MKILTLERTTHWTFKYYAFLEGCEVYLYKNIVEWLKENKIRYFWWQWRGEVYMWFLRTSDAVLFKITWG